MRGLFAFYNAFTLLCFYLVWLSDDINKIFCADNTHVGSTAFDTKSEINEQTSFRRDCDIFDLISYLMFMLSVTVHESYGPGLLLGL